MRGPTPQFAPGHGLVAYRPDIDGLRAIAVLAVLLFHAQEVWLPGGYLGVDVFFVISGYLITGIALRERLQGVFHWRLFYERRARRLIPALLAMLTATSLAACLWMQPQERAAYGRSLMATLGWVSNLYFWRTSAYFGEAASNATLLHTWSLAVEEQFYLLFPLLLAFITLRRVMGLLALTLALGLWSAATHPNAAFYLLPFRSWELLAGATLAALHLEAPAAADGWDRWLGVPALAGLLLALMLGRAGSDGELPLAANLAAVLCSAALIHAGRHGQGLQHRMLSVRPLVFVGLMSYSLYLWHQPVLSMLRLQLGAELPATPAALALLASLGLAGLSWRFVEQPWRRVGTGSTRAFVGGCLALGLALGAGGLWLHLNVGLTRPAADWQRALLSLDFDTQESQGLGRCFLYAEQSPQSFADCRLAGTGSGTALLWGDSHGAHLVPGFEVNRGWFGELVQRNVSGCTGLLPASGDAPRCAAARRFVLDEIRRSPPGHVLLAGRWTPGDAERLAQTVAELQRMGVERVSVLGPVPRWRGGLPGWLAQGSEGQLASERPLPLAESQARLNAQLRQALQGTGAQYLDALPLLCPHWPRCLTSPNQSLQGVLAWDADHLTRAGSEFLAEKLAPLLMAQPRLTHAADTR